MAERARTLIGRSIALVLRLWLWTLRVRVLVDSALDLGDRRPLVIGFWHGQQMLLLGAERRRATATLVSLSRDGQLQSGVQGGLGFRIVRGSSSRGGARGLCAMVRLLRQGADAVFAVDGPRGPRGRAKSGAVLAAAASGALLVPAAAASSRSLVLEGTWDRFEVPLPFARVVVVLGAPLGVRSGREALERAIERAEREARGALAAAPGAHSACPQS